MMRKWNGEKENKSEMGQPGNGRKTYLFVVTGFGRRPRVVQGKSLTNLHILDYRLLP
jgi:hypothetical protein